MNCQDFEKIVNDLARSQLIEAATREGAMRHAKDCPRCVSRLNDEKQITAGLRTLAASVESVEAPARVEEMLRAAFRAQAASPTLQPVSQHPSASRRWLRWALGAAAAILLLLALTAALWQRSSLPERPQEAKDSKPSVPSEEKPPPANDPAKKEETVSPQPVSKPRKRPKFSPGQRNLVAAKANVNAPNGRGTTATNNEEVATQFIPLVYGGNFGPLEGGQIVRVKLPRHALISLGLPVNMDRAGEPVKADVVIGHDGLARAIRFVRQE